jgi:hypothetical protein
MHSWRQGGKRVTAKMTFFFWPSCDLDIGAVWMWQMQNCCLFFSRACLCILQRCHIPDYHLPWSQGSHEPLVQAISWPPLLFPHSCFLMDRHLFCSSGDSWDRREEGNFIRWKREGILMTSIRHYFCILIKLLYHHHKISALTLVEIGCHVLGCHIIFCIIKNFKT